MHDLDYERLWGTFHNTDRKILIGLSHLDTSSLSSQFAKTVQVNSQNTVFSSLKRLISKGILIKTGKAYEFDDPFFRAWIIKRREM